MKRTSFSGALTLGLLLVCNGFGAWKPVAEPSSVLLQGGFAPNASHSWQNWEDPRQASLPYFGNFHGLGGTPGIFRTPEFRPARQIRLYLLGYPATPGIELYLVDVATQKRLPLKSTLRPALIWRERIWTLPPDWRGKAVYFVAESQQASDTGWVALRIPETGEVAAWLPFARAASRSFFLTLEFAGFLVPGIAIASLFAGSGQAQLAVRTLVSSALVAYAVFWVYVLNTKAGPIASALVFAASALILFRRILFKRKERLYGPDLRILAVTIVASALFYNSLCFLFYTDDGPGELVQMRFGPGQMPPDNLLQNMFAEKLANGRTVRPFLFANAHASDRPPLQTAAVLEQRPFWRLLSQDLSYQILSVPLQCLWVAGLGVLLTQMQIEKRTVVCAVAFTLFTLFAWQNSIYVWPKLMAASFCLLGMSAIPPVRGERKAWKLSETLLATAAFTLSLLSHSGTAFTILAILIFLTFRRALPPWRYCAIAIGLALLMILPWRAYQLFIDPPGDTLFKLHLAGVSNSQGSLLTALSTSYGKLTPAAFASAKFANVKLLFFKSGMQPVNSFAAFLQNMTELSFFSFFPCAGLLNLGLLARFGLSRNAPSVQAADRLLLIAMLSLLVWCLLMFEGGSTCVHQGSYATVLLYFAAMVIYLTAWSSRVMLILIAVQAVAIFPWFLTVEPVFSQSAAVLWNNSFDWGMATAALVSLVLLAGCAAAFLAPQRSFRSVLAKLSAT